MKEKIKIGFEDYTISYSDSVKDFDHMGKILYLQRVIYIDNSLTPRQKANTLLHEILHGISTDYLETELSEKQVEVLTNMLSTVIIDNEKIMKDLITNLLWGSLE